MYRWWDESMNREWSDRWIMDGRMDDGCIDGWMDEKAKKKY